MNKHDDPLFIIDDVGNIIFVNTSFCSVFGASEDELLKMNMFDAISGDGLTPDRIHEMKWENEAVIKSKVTKIVNLKLVPVINSKKHGVFACGIITRF